MPDHTLTMSPVDPATLGSCSFVCPNRMQATRLGRGFDLWGATIVTIEDRKVTVQAPMGFLMWTMQLASAGVIELFQEGKISAKEIKERYLPKPVKADGHFLVTDPGETTG